MNALMLAGAGVAEGFSVTGSLGTITEVIESVLTLISGNTVLAIFLVAPIMGIGISFVKRLVGRM